jgi:DNA replication protein DnaC
LSKKTANPQSNEDQRGLEMLLRSLRLPSFVAAHAEVKTMAEAGGWTFTRYLHHLAEMEVLDRQRRRIERNLKDSGLPSDKTVATLKTERLPRKIRTPIPSLC